MKLAAVPLAVVLALNAAARCPARSAGAQGAEVFDRVEMVFLSGDETQKVKVRLRLEGDALVVESRKTGDVLKRFAYSDIKGAEYSYSKHPRWKAGAATGALLFTPLSLLALPVAIPLAFSKKKRHWLTVRTGRDYAVLQLGKEARKLILPAFEVRTGVKVEAVGENK